MIMSSKHEAVITPGNVNQFDPRSLLANQDALDPTINGYLQKYFATTVNQSLGDIKPGTARELVSGIAHYEIDRPLFSVKPFRYLPLPETPEINVKNSAESSVRSAISNMTYMQDRFGSAVFSAESPSNRSVRAYTWRAPIDTDYELRVGGGSGSGTFSIDFGLGFMDRSGEFSKYKELWRCGVDTTHHDGALGARFIRTGSGVKEGKNSLKGVAFDAFNKRYDIMPQQLLGFVGLYFMRELEPDYALALTTEGATKLSTLKNSKGGCDYDGIFTNIGFRESTDSNWRVIPDFENGFYKAVSRHVKRRAQQDALHIAVASLKNMRPVDQYKPDIGHLFEPCSDESDEIISREIEAARHETD